MISKQYLKEDTRPTMYRGLKYWGKKPHNVWRELIVQYTKPGAIVYDPFAGSALTFFESLKSGRKPIIADINPLTLFLVDLYSHSFNLSKIQELANQIITCVRTTKFYQKNYTCQCAYCHHHIDLYNYRWHQGVPRAISYKCPYCNETMTVPNLANIYMGTFNLWKPTYNLQGLASISSSVIKKIGGDNISDLWTTRNLELLSLIFSQICNIKGIESLALMFGFLQILHLTSKMCALRGEDANRPLSSSWGRPAFLGLSSFMEQNPLIQFERAIFGNTGVIKCLVSREKYLPRYTYSTNIRDVDQVDGVVLLQDSKTINSGFLAQLLITDPPYGSIIQYGELSLVWNVWLQKYNKKYIFSLDNEIIVNKKKTHEKYIDDMICVWKQCAKLISNNAPIVITYNSNNKADWNALQRIFSATGLRIKNKKIQRNKRASEANVSCKKGIGITDYYFVLGRQ